MFNLMVKAQPKTRLLFNELDAFVVKVDGPPIALVSGLRKTGKTTLFAQIAARYIHKKTVLYLNFRENQVYSSNGSVEAGADAEQVLSNFLMQPNHQLVLLDELTCLEDYETVCDTLHDLAAESRGGWKYKVLATCSSPFHIKALSAGALGGSRSRLYYLPVLKFIEYLHLTTDHITYTDYNKVTATDFSNYLGLKHLPENMLKTFDEQYFVNYYEETAISDTVTMNRAGDSKLTSNELVHFANVLAYQIAGRINYGKLLKNNAGKNELPYYGGRKKFENGLRSSLYQVSKEYFKNQVSEVRHGMIARLINFLLKSYIVNAETELAQETDNLVPIGEILSALHSDTSEGDLVKIFKKVSFALNSPLLYTRLSDDILRKAGATWADFAELLEGYRNSLYGDLLELYLRGGISELEFNGTPFVSAKLGIEQTAAIDIVNLNLGILCESTTFNKDTPDVHLATNYKDNKLIRVCTTLDITDTKLCYYQIPYPVLCCMVDTGDILKLLPTTGEDMLSDFCEDANGKFNASTLFQ